MARKKIFISFDYDHDKKHRYLLKAFAKDVRSDIEFDDSTPGEIQSSDIGRIKSVLTHKIRNATHTLVLVGKYANSYHSDQKEIGTRNWQWWEIDKSAEEGKKFIAVTIEPENVSPEPLLLCKGVMWVYDFTVDLIRRAIGDA